MQFGLNQAVVSTQRCAKISTSQKISRKQQVKAIKDVFMPALSSTMTEGKIVTWLKQPGDKIAKGEPIVVVESDKADMDVESFEDGFLGAVVIEEGGVASVGDPIAYIAESEDELAAAKEQAHQNGAAPAAQVEAKEEAPVEEEKVEATAPAAAAAPPPAAAAPPPPPPPKPVGRPDGRIIATPYAKKLAKSYGVDLKTVGGTGPNGRITADDIEVAAGKKPASAAAPAATSNGAVPPAPAAPAAPAAAAAPALAVDTTVSELRGTTEPFNAMQMAVTKNMLDTLTVPSFRVTMQIETDALDALYKELKPKGVTMTAMLAKACGLALAQHPKLFAMCTPDGKGITYNEHVNVDVAVAMPDGGLITPVIEDADTTDLYSMSRTWGDLVKRARGKKLSPNEYSTGNFTLSNLGMFGVDEFGPLLQPGQAAILGVSASQPTVIATADGMMGVRKIMKVTLTADHKIVYGADSAAFLKTLKQVIEEPSILLK